MAWRLSRCRMCLKAGELKASTHNSIVHEGHPQKPPARHRGAQHARASGRARLSPATMLTKRHVAAEQQLSGTPHRKGKSEQRAPTTPSTWPVKALSSLRAGSYAPGRSAQKTQPEGPTTPPEEPLLEQKARLRETSQRETGRSERIRTSDPLLPKQVRYQAALRSDRCAGITRRRGLWQGGDGRFRRPGRRRPRYPSFGPKRRSQRPVRGSVPTSSRERFSSTGRFRDTLPSRSTM